MKPGKLYGIGVGPGASDLMTLRSINRLQQVDCIAIPRRDKFSASIAWTIAEGNIGRLDGQERFFLHWPMTRDPEILKPAWEIAFKEIGQRLYAGKSVAFICEGDPFVYSTFIYLYSHAQKVWPDVAIEVVPGVSSLSAVPVVAGMPIADGQERVAVVPASYQPQDLRTILRMFDTILLLKVSSVMPQVVEAIEAEGLLDRAVYVSKATMPQQKIIRDILNIKNDRCDYFSMVVVCKRSRSGILEGRAMETENLKGQRMMNHRRPWAIYAITKHGLKTGDVLMQHLPGADLFVSEKLMAQAPPGAQSMGLPMGPVLEKNFKAYDAHIFIISVGAVVRMVAPLLDNKKVDPAIICVDDKAQFVIPVLSGHVGRGNEFTHRIAAILKAMAVVTTASDVQETLTVDILGRPLGWVLDDLDRNVTKGCAAVVNQQPVLFVQETGEPQFWPLDKTFPPGITYVQSLQGVDANQYEIILLVTDRDIRHEYPEIYAKAVIYRPKSLVLGLGCDSNTPLELVERGIKKVLDEYGLDIRCVKAIATVDKKSQEPAFLELQKKYGWDLKIFTTDELNGVSEIPNPSARVEKFIGVKGVAEPSALLASGARELVVTKQIYKEADIPRSMTIAVARLAFAARQREAQYV